MSYHLMLDYPPAYVAFTAGLLIGIAELLAR